VLETVERHPHTVRYLAHWTDAAGRLCIAMEWAEKGSLSDHVREEVAAGRWTTLAALRAAQAIADGVAFIHRKGVVHRDLKMENVLVRGDGSIAISDFGLAKPIVAASVGGLGVGSYAVGSVLYAAPELVDGLVEPTRSVTYTNAIDVWAVGALTVTMLRSARASTSGATSGVAAMLTAWTEIAASPFGDPASMSTATMVDNIRYARADLGGMPADTPAAAVAVLRAALSRRGEDRPSAASLAAALVLAMEPLERGVGGAAGGGTGFTGTAALVAVAGGGGGGGAGARDAAVDPHAWPRPVHTHHAWAYAIAHPHDDGCPGIPSACRCGRPLHAFAAAGAGRTDSYESDSGKLMLFLGVQAAANDRLWATLVAETEGGRLGFLTKYAEEEGRTPAVMVYVRSEHDSVRVKARLTALLASAGPGLRDLVIRWKADEATHAGVFMPTATRPAGRRCRFYISGDPRSCRNGNACTYIHE